MVDAPQLGRREQDMRLKLSFETLGSDLQENETRIKGGKPSVSVDKSQGAKREISTFIDSSLCWDDIPWFKNRGVNTFSPEGRLFQVEYAIEAIKLGLTTIAVSTTDGIILVSGLVDDSRTMVEHARSVGQNDRFTFDELIKIESVTQAVGDLALRFGESMDDEEAMMSRPFGVALLIAGCDENGPQLFLADPSEGAQTELQERWRVDGGIRRSSDLLKALYF
ncbi:nucleophile aminohydrolase [Melampsora americana]|nr:nucleophile aminohydrolase [Melampsora americana]